MATASIGVRERMAAASRRIARVKLIDRGATGVITFGGIFIILSVLFIFVFIFGEAMPLFRGAKGERLGKISLAGVRGGTPHGTPLAFGADEYQKYLYEITPDAHLVVFRLADGATHREMALPGVEGTAITSASRGLAGDSLAAGTADGRVALSLVRFRPVFEGQVLKDLDIDLRPRGVIAIDPAKRPVREVVSQVSAEGRDARRRPRRRRRGRARPGGRGPGGGAGPRAGPRDAAHPRRGEDHPRPPRAVRARGRHRAGPALQLGHSEGPSPGSPTSRR